MRFHRSKRTHPRVGVGASGQQQPQYVDVILGDYDVDAGHPAIIKIFIVRTVVEKYFDYVDVAELTCND